MRVQKIIKNLVKDSIATKEVFFDRNLKKIEDCTDIMVKAFKSDKKLLLFGNGGSAADSQHIAAEFVNRFQIERRPLPAIALTTDTSIITSIGNDYSYEEIFSKQVLALGAKNDIAIGISTSGNSPNVIKAIKVAKQKKLITIGFTGEGGKLNDISDICFCVDSRITARIQEVHILLAHILCDIVETKLFKQL